MNPAGDSAAVPPEWDRQAACMTTGRASAGCAARYLRARWGGQRAAYGGRGRVPCRSSEMTFIACSHISIRRIVFRTDGNIGRETSTAELRWHSQGETRSRRPDAVRSSGKGIVASNLRLGARARTQRARVSRAAQARSSAPWKLGRTARRNRNRAQISAGGMRALQQAI
jgi:hypothetical protein